jgi:uncharacterized protein YjbJ (UPF0337 family)
MNAEQLKGQWKQIRGEVRKQWGKLTDEDLDRSGGEIQKLSGKIQEKYGVAKDAAEEQIRKFTRH